jgi:hypothetical protein
MKTLSLLSLTAALTMTVSALADAQPPTPPPAKHAQSCFWQRQIQNFAASDDSTLYVRVGASDIYQLKLFSPCIDLAWDHHLAIVAHGGGDICEGNGLDTEIVAPETGIGHQRCQVTSIRKLAPAEIAALPRDARP